MPTEAEWEKASRGPDHDDQDEHLVYPWGNTRDDSSANFGKRELGRSQIKPVGYYDGNQTPIADDMVNGYGLYDMIGNVAEWTRSFSANVVTEYPATETLNDSLCGYGKSKNRVVRGGGSCFSSYFSYHYSDYPNGVEQYVRFGVKEEMVSTYSSKSNSADIGFRIVRRVDSGK